MTFAQSLAGPTFGFDPDSEFQSLALACYDSLYRAGSYSKLLAYLDHAHTV